MRHDRIVLLEEHCLLRDCLETLLRTAAEFEVVGAAADPERAFDAAQQHNANVAVIGVSALGDRAIATIQQFRQRCPDIRLLAINVDAADADVLAMIRAGVTGLIVKDTTLGEFMATLRAVAAGRSILPLQLTPVLFAQRSNDDAGTQRGDRAETMTTRERQVMELIAQGFSNKEIAAALNIATHTVKSHVHNILEKLSLDSRLQVAAYARSQPPSALNPKS